MNTDTKYRIVTVITWLLALAPAPFGYFYYYQSNCSILGKIWHLETTYVFPNECKTTAKGTMLIHYVDGVPLVEQAHKILYSEGGYVDDNPYYPKQVQQTKGRQD